MTEISDWRKRKERSRLIGYKCSKCGEIFYPRVYRCRKCGSTELKPIELPRRGHIVEYTIIKLLPERYSSFGPYSIAVIELVNGVRVIAQLTDIDLDKIKAGMEVEATLRKLYEYGNSGKIIYGVKFRPVLTP